MIEPQLPAKSGTDGGKGSENNEFWVASTVETAEVCEKRDETGVPIPVLSFYFGAKLCGIEQGQEMLGGRTFKAPHINSELYAGTLKTNTESAD